MNALDLVHLEPILLTKRLHESELDCEFFVVNGKVPILLANDTMAPLGGTIDMDENVLVF